MHGSRVRADSRGEVSCLEVFRRARAEPDYEMVCTGLTGHAEVIQIEYDPAVVSYEKLLSVFWSAHDPTTLNRQEDDFGPQYRSIILYHNEDQKKAAEKSYRDLTAHRVFHRRS